MNPSRTEDLCFGRLSYLLIYFLSLLLYYSDCFLLGWVLIDFVFQRIDAFHLGDQICGHWIVHSILLLPAVSVSAVSVLIYPVLFLIALINVLSLFLLSSMARGLSILLIFLISNVCFHWSFFHQFPWFLLYYFFTSYFGFSSKKYFFSFSGFLRQKLRLFIDNMF